MKRKHIVTAFAITLASTAALAQSGPDFSPMKPGNLEEQREQSQSAPEPPVTTENRLLDAYEASAPPLSAEPYSPPAVETRRVPYSTQPPRQSTIGNGLFDSRGPNDFGS